MLCSSFLQLTTFTSHSAKDRCSSCDVTHWFVKFWSQTRVEHFHHHHLDVLKPYMIVAGQRAVSICVTVFLQPRVSPPGGCKKESRLQVLLHRSLFRPKGNVHRLMILYAFCHMTTRGLTHSLACFLFIGGYCLDKNFQMRLWSGLLPGYTVIAATSLLNGSSDVS